MTPNIPLIAWSPDTDPTRPGVIVEVSNLLPTARGYAPDFSPADAIGFTSALPERPNCAEMIVRANELVAMVAGTSTKLYALPYGSAPVDRSVGGGSYAATTEVNPWSFVDFAGYVFASNLYNQLQYSADPMTADFLAVSGAPAAGTMCAQRNFLITARFGASDTPDHPYGDGWWCSSQEDATSGTAWTPDIATQCARGRLTATPGDILRLIAFQDAVLAFKDNSVYRGTYTGPSDNTWSWPVLSQSVGLASQRGIASAGSHLYWFARDGAYRYNGANIERIASAPWEWILDKAGGPNGLQFSTCQWDPIRRVVRWNVLRELFHGWGFGVAYHPDTDRWGVFDMRASVPVSAPLQGDIPSVSGGFVAAAFTNGRSHPETPAYFDFSTNVMKVYKGAASASSWTTGDIGDDDAVTAMMRGRSRYLRAPATSTMTHYYRMSLENSLTTGATADRVDGKYDVSHAARWHRMMFTQTGMYEVTGFSVGPQSAGKR